MDDVDVTSEKMEIINEAALFEVRKKVAAIEVGVAGECNLCGEDSLRLVNHACARCRDKYKLP